jgi:VanZ family protein
MALADDSLSLVAAAPWLWIAVYVLARFLSGSGGLSALQNVTWTPVEQYSDAKMQTLCFDHLLDLSLAWQTKRKTGETMRTLDRGYALTNLLQVRRRVAALTPDVPSDRDRPLFLSQIVLFNITPIVLDISIALVVFCASRNQRRLLIQPAWLLTCCASALRHCSQAFWPGLGCSSPLGQSTASLSLSADEPLVPH